MEPTLVVLVYSSVAALAAGLGALPLVTRSRLPRRVLGLAMALAAGMMLAAAFTLSVAEVDAPPVIEAVAAVIGIVFIHGTHRASGGDQFEPGETRVDDPAFGFRVLLVDALHAVPEGVAIGAGMAIDIGFGSFLALAIAVHNVPEAAVLASVCRARGARPIDVAGLAIAVNVPQVLLAIVTFAICHAAPEVLHWAVGFAVGALVQLVMVESLPGSYRNAGTTSIAVVAVVAMSAVVLVRGLAGLAP